MNLLWGFFLVLGVSVVVGVTVVIGYMLVQRQMRAVCSRIGIQAGSNPLKTLDAISRAIEDDRQNLKLIAVGLREMSETNNLGRLADVTGEAGTSLRHFYDQIAALREEEAVKHWSIKGQSMLADLKKNNSSVQQYATLSIQTLVKYMDCNQGRLFTLENEATELVLTATYAYDKLRYRDGKLAIDASSGLLGQCVIERECIYLSEVPADYVKITSGLGQALPRVLLIIPLIYRDQIYGVIEVASFLKLQPYKIEFAKKFCEGIAAEMSGLLEQQKTEVLLQSAQSSAEQLRAQEEELRQAMEKMAETQEALMMKETMLKETIDQIEIEKARNKSILENCGDAVISFDENGKIDFVNNAAGELFGYDSNLIVERNVQDLVKIRIEHNGKRPRLINQAGEELTGKTEIMVTDKDGNELSLLVTAANVRVGNEWFFSLLAQKISVELF